MTVINKDIIYDRDNIDQEENNNGKELIKLMNSTGMIILTGIKNKSKYKKNCDITAKTPIRHTF